jgi:hypothetical protein
VWSILLKLEYADCGGLRPPKHNNLFYKYRFK